MSFIIIIVCVFENVKQAADVTHEVLSCFSGHLVGGLHHGRDDHRQTSLPRHRSYPSFCYISLPALQVDLYARQSAKKWACWAGHVCKWGKPQDALFYCFYFCKVPQKSYMFIIVVVIVLCPCVLCVRVCVCVHLLHPCLHYVLAFFIFLLLIIFPSDVYYVFYYACSALWAAG